MMNFEAAGEAFSAADIGRLCRELSALFPNDQELDRLEELARFAVSGGPFPQGVQPSTRVFLESLARVAAHERTGGSWERRPHRTLSRELDFIADLGGVQGWTLGQALNRIALDRLKPGRGCAVVGTMRDDGIYIMEWVAYYLALGFVVAPSMTGASLGDSGISGWEGLPRIVLTCAPLALAVSLAVIMAVRYTRRPLPAVPRPPDQMFG